MFAKRIVALAMVVWAIVLASNLDAQQKFDPANIVRVSAGDSIGSGVYLGDKLVLTAAHVFEQQGSKAVVAFPDSTRIAGTLLSVDKVWDQAMVELAAVPMKATGAPLAQANPAIGETVYAAGYPGGRSKLVWIAGQVNNYAAPDRTRPPDWFVFRGEAAHAGASGGPVYNSKGEVIGNLWGSREVEMTTTATMCGRTRLFLNPFRGRLGGQGQAQAQAAPRGRQIYIAPRQLGQSGSCGPSGCPAPGLGNRDVQIVPRDPGGEAPIIDMPTGPIVTQPPITTPQIDYNAIADLVFKKIQENPDAFRGPAGPPGEITADHINAVIDGLKNDESFAAKLQGPTGPAGPEGLPGKAGVDGKDGKDAQLTAEQMATMVAAILQNLKQDPTFVSELQGPPGPPGKDGEKGKDAQVTADQLATMSAAILKNLKNDNEFTSKLKGPAGPEGKEGPPGPACDLSDLTARIDALEGTLVNIPDGGSEWSHLVLIADSTADYWPRLSSEFERAKGRWAKMRQIEPPDDRYIGPLPVLVAYTAGKPVQNWVGQRNVSQALSNITRGDYDQFIIAQK